MKNIWLAALAILFVFTNCDNELDINAPHEDVTVVYSTLNKDSATNWVRIHRGYLGNAGIAGGNQDADSIYYNNLNVSIEEINENGTVENTFVLTKDDSPQVANKLDSGFFTQDGYHLYRLDETIDVEKSYRIVVEKPDGEGTITSSTTPIVASYNITRPIGSQRISFGSRGQDFVWDQAENAFLYQAYLRFSYVEISIFDPADSVRKFVDYVMPTSEGTNTVGNGDITRNVSYESFYGFLKNRIEENDEVIRFFRSMDLHVIAAAEDLSTYILISQPAQGIVQDKPFYTNIENGIGIFSSVGNSKKLGMDLSSPSLDSLVYGIYTCPLNFAKTSVSDTCQCLVPGQLICN